MSTRSRETFQSLLAAPEHWTRRANDGAKRIFSRRKGAPSPPEGNGTSPGVFDYSSPTSLGGHDETTRTRSSLKDEREAIVLALEEDKVGPSTRSVEVDSATPRSQEAKTAERAHSSVEDIKTVHLPEDETVADSHPPNEDNIAPSSRAVVTAQRSGSMEDESACKHKAFCVPKYWR